MSTAAKNDSLCDLIRPYISLFSGGSDPLICLDSTLKCVWERGGVFSVGDDLLSYVNGSIPNPMHDLTEACVCRDERSYCCRIMPIKNAAGESDAYICELLTSQRARSIGERADSVSDLLPLYNAVEYNSACVWKSAEKLRERFMQGGDYSNLSEALEIEKAMSNISAVCGNAFRYAEMLSDRGTTVRIDAGALCRKLGERCNAALAKCGRRIEVLIEPEDLTIYADSRRAVVALVNAVQNAMLYSPRDSEPIMAVYHSRQSGRDFVEIRLTNENVMFTAGDFKNNVDINFSSQRLGYGIPIIKRFASVCGGRFSMEDKDGKVIVTITLPAAGDSFGPLVTLNSPELGHYTTGKPDFTDVMMSEVVQFFGEVRNAD